jgi:hypothetical protein
MAQWRCVVSTYFCDDSAIQEVGALIRALPADQSFLAVDLTAGVLTSALLIEQKCVQMLMDPNVQRDNVITPDFNHVPTPIRFPAKPNGRLIPASCAPGLLVTESTVLTASLRRRRLPIDVIREVARRENVRFVYVFVPDVADMLGSALAAESSSFNIITAGHSNYALTKAFVLAEALAQSVVLASRVLALPRLTRFGQIIVPLERDQAVYDNVWARLTGVMTRAGLWQALPPVVDVD